MTRFDEVPQDAYENYPCPECNGEITYFEGTWICNKCERNYKTRARQYDDGELTAEQYFEQ